MFAFSFFLRSAKYIEKRPADRPSDIQWAPKLRAQIDQVLLNVLQNSKCAPLPPSRSRLVRSPFFNPYFLMYFGRSLAAFWCPFDTLFQCRSCWCLPFLIFNRRTSENMLLATSSPFSMPIWLATAVSCLHASLVC